MLSFYSKKRLDRLLKAQDDAEEAKNAGTAAGATAGPATPSTSTATATEAPKAGKRGGGKGKTTKNGGDGSKVDGAANKTPTKKRKAADMTDEAEGGEEIDE